MQFHPRTSRLLTLLLAAAILTHATSCGTILYPERRGQPAGPLDPKVVVLDAVGLLVFFIPGVIAFAVDFSNGTIYLPPEERWSAVPAVPRNGVAANGKLSAPIALTDMTAVRVDPRELDRQKIEAVLAARTGQPVRLDGSEVRVRQVARPQEFSAEYATLLDDAASTPPVKVSFAR